MVRVLNFMPLLIFLPLAAFIFIVFLLFKITSFGKSLIFVWATLIWTLCAVSLVEVLSVFHCLTQGFVVGGWGLVIFVISGCWIFLKKKSLLNRPPLVGTFSFWEWAGLTVTAFIICAIGINAIFAAPNNWDSMTYHLPRVLHWVQNQSVEHYPTHILRQLYQPPGAEFLILHLQILTGGDHFANCIQWFSLLGSAIVLSLIAIELGVGRVGQVLTGLLTVTIPMAILQGSSTQNDLVVGFWLACFAYFSVRLLKALEPTPQRWMDVLGAALSLAFALLTKGSAYLFVIPWALFFVLWGAFKKRKMFLGNVAVIVLVCLIVNAGFYVRNIRLFGAPLSTGTENYVNKGNVLGNTALNVIRNASLHLATPIPAVNQFVRRGILALQSSMSDSNDNSWSDFDILMPSTSEDVAGNPLHFLLILFAFTVVLFSQRFSSLPRVYVGIIIAGFIIFCSLLKWQLFHSRLHLPLFLLSVPILALALERIRSRWVVGLISTVLVLAVMWPLFCNERHPLIGKKNVFNMSRLEQYFSYRKFMALPYVLAVKYATSRPDSNIGLLLGPDDWEYPLWVLLKRENPHVRVRHSGVENVSKRLTIQDDSEVSVVISEVSDATNGLILNEQVYLKQQQFAFMSLYAR